ncbi:WXG100 family type VII secretion target [Angustibacter sp. McL0619]|uniref:WXG100 family type VII secretion target n=1 Tax=Angustibacter sp. McL0619 TaxID=3415676 RepID=UPI003CF8C629
MASYSFDPDAAETAEGEFRGSTNKLEQMIDALTTAVNNFKAHNAGAAIASYELAQRDWDNGQREMNESLTKGISALNTARGEYIHADHRGKATFGGH